jgi:hypothetical protein
MADPSVGWVAPTVNTPGGRDRLLALHCSRTARSVE